MTSSRFLEAVGFATLKHAGQKREAANRCHVPYMVHPIEVAQILAECGIQDEDILIAAILHDTLEDTDATENDLKFKFGTRVLSIVKENTDDPKLDKAAQKQMQIVNAPNKSYAAKLVKLADKTSNMRDIVRLPPPWKLHKIIGYVNQARSVAEKLIENGGNPRELEALFWRASQDALDACKEAELKNSTIPEAVRNSKESTEK